MPLNLPKGRDEDWPGANERLLVVPGPSPSKTLTTLKRVAEDHGLGKGAIRSNSEGFSVSRELAEALDLAAPRKAEEEPARAPRGRDEIVFQPEAVVRAVGGDADGRK